MKKEQNIEQPQKHALWVGAVMCRFFIPKAIMHIFIWLITSFIGAYLIKILNQIL